MRTRLILSALTLSTGCAILPGYSNRACQPLGVGVGDKHAIAGVDAELTVDRSMADDFAREALAESADRPIARQELVVRMSEGHAQMFWMVQLVGSWKTAYVFANGERAGSTILEDDRITKPAPLSVSKGGKPESK